MSKRKPAQPAPAAKEERVWLDLKTEERQLFEREFAGVVPLGGVRRVPIGKKAAVASRRSSRPVDNTPTLSLTEEATKIEGAAYGVSHETLHKLARGHIRIEKTCDLHGLAAQVARHACERFVVESARAGLRAVLIVCGRGLHSGDDGPVLRKVVVDVLRSSRHHVLGFTSLPAERGGTGALAVLLRRG